MLNASIIGNHEFDYASSWVEIKVNRANYKILVYNIKDNSTKTKIGALGKNHESSYIYNKIR